MSIGIDIRDGISPTIEAIGEAIDLERLGPAIGTAAVNLFRDHLLANPENAQGWPTTNYWARAARATSWQLAGGEGVTVSVAIQGILQRYFGGEIKPVHGQYLTIPARAEAYGKRAGEFTNLHVAWKRVGGKPVPWALVENRATQVSLGKIRKDGTRPVTKGEEIGEAVFFWLVKSVTQKGDSIIIPSDEEIGQTALGVVSDAIDLAKRRAAA